MKTMALMMTTVITLRSSGGARVMSVRKEITAKAIKIRVKGLIKADTSRLRMVV